MKRRGHGEGHVRKRADGRWEAMITGADGKRHSVYARTRTELTAKIREATEAKRKGQVVPHGRLTLAGWLDTWLPRQERALRRSTWASYESYVRQHIRPGLGAIPLVKLTKDDVNDFLVKATGARGPLAPRTVHHLRAILRNALNDAMADGKVAINAAEMAAPPRVEPREPVALTKDEAARLTAILRDHPDGAIYMLGMRALRLGEVLGLRWRDVDLVDGRLTVQQSYGLVKGERVFGPPKSEPSRRTVGIAGYHVEGLLRVRDRQSFAKARVARYGAWEEHGGGDLVFTDDLGRPRNPASITRELHRILRAAGITDMGFHGLRHSAATILIADAVGAKVVSELLGHSDIAITLRTYTHVSEGMRKAATDRLDTHYLGPVARPS